MPTEGHAELGEVPVVPHYGTVGHELRQKAGKQTLQDFRTTRPQCVNVTALGHAPSLCTLGRQHIALDDRDGSVEIRQHSGRKETAHARPENDRMLTDLRHGDLLSSE
jgi:hypothetical protein